VKVDEREFKDELEEVQDLPIDPRLAIQTSYGTIRYLIDAVVELVTNADDSYKRLEQEGIGVEEKIIKINIRRLKHSKCEKLEVLDLAEGMDKEQLKKALRFAGEASGFEKGKSVRGFFGRGLKEAILALGKGEIYTIKDDKLSKAILWKEGNRPKYRPPKESRIPSQKEREEIGIIQRNGTVVKITVTNEKIKCPECKTLVPRIVNHYALRDINSTSDREITLDFEAPEKHELKHLGIPISYEMPKGKEIINQDIKLPGYGDNVKIRIYESDEELESPYNNPFARAGLLIKTAGAILDNQLFKYQNEKAGCFFFGEVIWADLAERLRKGESLLDLNRVGIEWREKVCQILQKKIEEIIEPHIEKKRKQLEVKPTKTPSEKINKLNRAICSLLNRLTKDHFSELPPDTGPGDKKIEDLTIKPPYANIEINKERPFSVYASIDILDSASGRYGVEVKSDNPHIQVLDPSIELEAHRKYAELYYGTFRLIGRIDKEEATISCKLGEYKTTAVVRVAPPGKIGKRKKMAGTKGGFFREIKPDLTENPQQRVRYDEGNRIIWISVKFSGVEKYFDDALNFKSVESRPMYAELIGEAFCRFIATDYIEKGVIPKIPGNEIGSFIIAMNEAQKKYLHLIHGAIIKHKL